CCNVSAAAGRCSRNQDYDHHGARRGSLDNSGSRPERWSGVLWFYGPALRAARIAKGLKVGQLGHLVGRVEGIILKYESGEAIPRANMAAALADAVGVDLLDLSTDRPS